ncbi:MAG: Clp protease N-terminal domain-containing protein [Mycobacterium leprae]
MVAYTPAAVAVVARAQVEARQLGYPFIQREQLFLALLTNEAVSRICKLLAVDPESIRVELTNRLLPGLGAGDEGEELPLLPTAEQVYRHRAHTAATLLGHTQIGPVDILLGFLLEQHGLVVEVLHAMNITTDRVIGAIQALDS